MKIYSSAVFFALTYSIHFNENNWSTANGTGCMDGPGNPSTDADGNRSISFRELKVAVFEKVSELIGGLQKPISRVEIMDDWIVWE